MRLRALVALLVLAPHVALAGVAGVEDVQQSFRTAVLDAATNTACDANVHNVAAPACAYFQVPMLGYTEVTLLVFITKGAATDLRVWMDAAVDQDGDGAPDVPWGALDAGTFSSPAITMVAEYVLWDTSGLAGSATIAHLVTFRNINADFARWRWVSTAGNSSDHVKIWLVRRGR